MKGAEKAAGLEDQAAAASSSFASNGLRRDQRQPRTACCCRLWKTELEKFLEMNKKSRRLTRTFAFCCLSRRLLLLLFLSRFPPSCLHGTKFANEFLRFCEKSLVWALRPLSSLFLQCHSISSRPTDDLKRHEAAQLSAWFTHMALRPPRNRRLRPRERAMIFSVGNFLKN